MKVGQPRNSYWSLVEGNISPTHVWQLRKSVWSFDCVTTNLPSTITTRQKGKLKKMINNFFWEM